MLENMYEKIKQTIYAVWSFTHTNVLVRALFVVVLYVRNSSAIQQFMTNDL